MHRVNARLKEIKTQNGVIPWDLLYRRSVFSWAGHVSRMRQYDEQRLTYRVFNHRCWDWICSVASANHGSQLHGRRFKVWRWEGAVYNFFQTGCWEDAAQDRLGWDANLDEMMHWRRTRK